ncbi:MAG: trypsin-like peptidase domain-containing protein [Clostridia bacterium]
MEENKSNQKVVQTNNKTQGVFIKEKKQIPNILITIVVALISTFMGCALTFYAVKTYLASNNVIKSSTNNATNINYKIEKTDSPVVAIAKKAGPSIVGVKVKYTSQGIFGSLQQADEEGSGIIYSEDGFIITNYHVIEAAIKNSTATVTITLPNSEDTYDAVIKGYDATTDLAVVKIDKKGLTPAEFGKSKALEVGEIAVAIGNPLGQEFAGSVTVGYVSALNRKVSTDGRTYKLIQTDAAINPGNSGGALVNSEGMVIGINTVKVGSSMGSSTSIEGLGFAIPIDDALPIIQELITNKKIVRPYIGIGGIDLDTTTAKRNDLVVGIYVAEVMNATPASKAGIQKGDVIIKADDKEAKKMEALNEIKNSKKVGDTLKLTINRVGKEMDVVVTLTSDDETLNLNVTN